MNEVRTCEQCGAVLDSTTLEGLCLRCVLATVGSIRLDVPVSESGTAKLEDSAREAVGVPAVDTLTALTGTTIGRYKLLQQIGEGGFGIVFMAEQTEPVQRKVALKIIKAGMDTREVIARFEAERQALALMDHPNIAQVLDGGATTSGRPYFVMELVRGLPITEYCDQASLGTRERLGLFIKVCRAVQHAHQKGVIHRDLKPSNVLVTLHDGEPVPKVIDFGVAKALGQKLTDKTLFTRFEQMLGTPAYMSPEQAALSGLDIDTRSDIYSLGVLLYELLTGVTPFDAETFGQAALDEIRRVIQEAEPLKPSTRLLSLGDRLAEVAKHRQAEPAALTRLIRGDLDWITMKALEKDRHRRYETVNGLAADLERHLNHEPVLARPPSAAYRFERAFRRHRLAFAAGAAVAVALLLGVVVSMWQAVRATRAERQQSRLRAQAQAAQAGEAAQRQRTEAAVTRLEIERAEGLFAAANSSRGLAYLARLLRQQPTNRVVAERLLSALGQRSFCLPATPPLRSENRLSLSAPPRMGRSILAANFSPDGRRVVTASKHGTACIWDTPTGLPLWELKHQGEVVWAAFSPDGRRVVTASRDHTAQIWDVQTGRASIPALQHNDAVLFADFSPDSRKVTTASKDKSVRIWDADTGRLTAAPITHTAAAWFATFSADANRLLTASDDGKARLWDGSSGAEIASFLHGAKPDESETATPFPQLSPDGKRVVTLQGRTDALLWDVGTNQSPPARLNLEHNFSVTTAQFSPNGELVATASRDNTARIWDVHSGKAVSPPLRHDNWVMSVRFSADGERVVTSSRDFSVRVWDVRTGRALTEPLRHEFWVWSAQFSPDGQRILTVSGGDQVWLWDVRWGPAVTELFGHKSDVRRAVFSRDGQRIATGSWDGTARVWEARTGRSLAEMWEEPDWVMDVQFSPNGRQLAKTHLLSLRLWDAATGKILLGPLQPMKASAMYARFSSDGQFLLGTSKEKVTRVWNATNGQLIAQTDPGHANRVESAEFSPDGARFITASWDGTARLWDSRTGRPLCEPLKHEAEVVWADFSPDGQRVATASRDKTVRIWDGRTGQMLTSPLPHADELYEHHSIHFSPDGKLLATAAGDVAQIWDVRTAEPLTAPLRHGGRVNCVQFSPDGQRLVTASYDATARIWDVATGHPLSEALRHDARVQYAEFSPDGRYVVTASTDKTARIWEIALAPSPIPDWLPALAEAIAGQKIDARDNSVLVPVEELFKLKQRLGTGDGPDYYQRWAKWFFADGALRTLTPSSPVTVPQYLQRRKAEHQYALQRREGDFHYDLGRAYSRSNQWAEAISEFSTAIGLTPDDCEYAQARLFAARATNYFRLGEGQCALADLTKAHELNVAYPAASNVLAGLYSDRARNSLRLGEAEEALADFMKAHELSTNYVEGYYARARAYGARNEFRRAIADLDQALQRAPQNTHLLAALHIERAQHLMRVSEPERALADFAKAHELGAHHFEAYHARAHAFAATNKLRESIADLNEALKRAPQNATNLAHLHFDRAYSYARLREYEKAVPDYEKAMALDANLAIVPNNLAWHYATGPSDFRSPEKALPLALKAADLTGRTNADYLNTLGVVYYRLGESAKAMETFEKYLKSDGTGGTAFDYFFLAMACHRLGHTAKAQAHYASALKWVADQTSFQPTWKDELQSFRAEAEEVLGITKSQ